jgi:hypothetical protein
MVIEGYRWGSCVEGRALPEVGGYNRLGTGDSRWASRSTTIIVWIIWPMLAWKEPRRKRDGSMGHVPCRLENHRLTKIVSADVIKGKRRLKPVVPKPRDISFQRSRQGVRGLDVKHILPNNR